jgi:hypothetical protein
MWNDSWYKCRQRPSEVQARSLPGSRDLRFDTLRGLFLVCMTVNHLPTEIRKVTDQPLGSFPPPRASCSSRDCWRDGSTPASCASAGAGPVSAVLRAGQDHLPLARGLVCRRLRLRPGDRAGARLLLPQRAPALLRAPARPRWASGLAPLPAGPPGPAADVLRLRAAAARRHPGPRIRPALARPGPERRRLARRPVGARSRRGPPLPDQHGLLQPLRLAVHLRRRRRHRARPPQRQAQVARPSPWVVLAAAAVAVYGFGILHAHWGPLWPDPPSASSSTSRPSGSCAWGLRRVAYLVAIVGARFPSPRVAPAGAPRPPFPGRRRHPERRHHGLLQFPALTSTGGADADGASRRSASSSPRPASSRPSQAQPAARPAPRQSELATARLPGLLRSDEARAA